MKANDIFTFFDLPEDDALKIKWAHAANTIDSLNVALMDPEILMIESDIILSSSSGIVVMAHPPLTDSNLSFEQWLLTICQWNESKKGAKADFKSIESVELALKMVSKHKNIVRFPLWLNADVCPGIPGSKEPLDGEQFLTFCKQYSQGSLLSLGWTTPANLTEDMRNRGGYGSNEINAMISLLENVEETTSVTFPVRASLITGNLSDLINLLSKSCRYSLTVWTSKNDILEQKDFRALAEIRKRIGKNRVFYDLPDNDLAQLIHLLQ